MAETSASRWYHDLIRSQCVQSRRFSSIYGWSIYSIHVVRLGFDTWVWWMCTVLDLRQSSAAARIRPETHRCRLRWKQLNIYVSAWFWTQNKSERGSWGSRIHRRHRLACSSILSDNFNCEFSADIFRKTRIWWRRLQRIMKVNKSIALLRPQSQNQSCVSLRDLCEILTFRRYFTFTLCIVCKWADRHGEVKKQKFPNENRLREREGGKV